MRLACSTCGGKYEAPQVNGEYVVTPDTIATVPISATAKAITPMCPACASSLIFTPNGG